MFIYFNYCINIVTNNIPYCNPMDKVVGQENPIIYLIPFFGGWGGGFPTNYGFLGPQGDVFLKNPLNPFHFGW